MPTWSDVREHLRRKLTLATEEAEWFGLVWSFKSGKPGLEAVDVMQRQRIELVQAVGEPHVLVICDIVEIDKAQPYAMLAHNMSIAIGGVAISENWYVMREVVPLESLDLAYFERSLSYLAHEAARLRELIPAS